MAIFEKSYDTRKLLDDTHTITCIIETAQEVKGHTEYLLRLERGPQKECWKLLRRYNEFDKLQKCLSISGIELPMPGKRLFGNMRPDFVAERRQALQNYINAVLMNPILASSLTTKRFVDPDSYSQSFHDQAIQNALLCLRVEGTWTLGSSLGAIGWRLRKHYFNVSPKPPEKSGSKLLVKSGSQSQQSKNFASSSGNGSGGSLDSGMMDPSELVLEWLEYGPDKHIDDKELGGILKSLIGLRHPHIETIVHAGHNENGCLVIRKFHKHGTLKDILCMATPKNPFLSKYGNPKGRTAISLKQLANYGRQILETLMFLHAKGYPYGHLHSGNIVIVDDCVKLLDIENYILGVPSFYRPFFVQHSKIHSIETIDVYCFGHVLFEMAMGYPLQESLVRQINDCPESLKNLLESILSKDASRSGLPTFEQLLNHKFFKEHAPNGSASACSDIEANAVFKLSASAKEALKQAAQKCDNRLRDEQRSVKNQKRLVRVQELMSSEEEKRKCKQKAKLEHKQSKLKSQSSLQANNGRPSLAIAGSSASAANQIKRQDSVRNVFGNRDESSTAPTPPTNSSSQVGGSQHGYPASPQHQHSSPSYSYATGQMVSTASVERQSSSPNLPAEDQEQDEPTRSALLESICKFNRGSLRKVRSND